MGNNGLSKTVVQQVLFFERTDEVITKSFSLDGPLGTVRSDPWTGILAATVRPMEQDEVMIHPRKEMEMVFQDATGNPNSRVTVEGYSVRCDKYGLWAARNVPGPVSWNNFASAMTIKQTESLMIDRFGSFKYSDKKILLFSYGKLAG